MILLKFITITIMIALFNYVKCNQHQLKTKEKCPDRPIEKEEHHLRRLIFCNADNMQSGDPCYCGRMLIECCASKELCTGSASRTCSKPLSDYYCEKGIGKGLAYWYEFDQLADRFSCKNQYYDNSMKFCFCYEQCCTSSQYCSSFYQCEEGQQLNNEACLRAVKKVMRNKQPKKYYENYRSDVLV